MISKAEEHASAALRAMTAGLRAGDSIARSEAFSNLESALEVFLPELLCEKYPSEWTRESPDAFQLPVARATGEREAEFLGLCLLISDQSWTPVYVRIRVAVASDTIERIVCMLGEGGPGSRWMTRVPHGSSRVGKLLFETTERPGNIRWTFTLER